MTILENLKTTALQQASLLRSTLFFVESIPLQILENYVVRGKFGLIEVPSGIDKEMLADEIKELINKDVENFSKGLYPLSVLNVDKPVTHVKNLARIYLDSVSVVLNKKYNRHKEFSSDNKEKMKDMPAYYKRNFHNQTDGYLSKKSAELYDHQVELVFKGTSDIIRRLMIEGLSKFYSKDEKLKVVEVACGTGVSTKPLALTYKNSMIDAFDLSKDYVDYASQKMPFDNVTYKESMGESLVGVADNTYDVWCSTFLFHELPKDARFKVIKEAYRVLKPGGRIFILDSVQEHDRPELKPLLDLFPKNYHEPFYKNYVKSPLENQYKEVGFNEINSFNRGSGKVIYGLK